MVAPARPPLDSTRLAEHGIGVLPATGSTNAVVADLARDGAPGWTVVVTEHQTAGRGRLDRTWDTPDRAALTFSTLLRPSVAGGEWPWLPLLAGVAVAGALREAGVPATLKWPNDVLIGGRKTAGILAERLETPTGPAAVVGIGLNVHQRVDELPVPTATSVEHATGAAPDRTDLLLDILSRLRRQYDAWSVGGGAAVRPAYVAACETIGQDVRVALPGDEDLTGPATDVDQVGRLVVAGRPIAAGDVVHVRPTE
ncbi:biotin--[acetyl-CoA-carboxylase] ligase [Nocardioides sp.]|uniref:biotin--[acetyl-CoA-carboxylase] ligase n=1 Tax=Nocardioides sp. TaxID=35761 RepID=UPI002ED4B424